MNTLLHYDLLRLEAFQQNPEIQNAIAINQCGELTLLKFKPINYFNYCIGKIESTQVIDYVEEFYADIHQKNHQVIIDSKDLLSLDIIKKFPKYKQRETICIMTLSPEEEPVSPQENTIQLKLVLQKDIAEFAWLYLNCFDAENRHEESVVENFRLKLKAPGLEFYFIMVDGVPVGITGLYFHPEFTVLSVGAIQEKYRFQGYHKSALSDRIKRAKTQNPEKPIYSWAYKNSISHQNMIKSGLKLSQEFLAFQHAG